MEGLIFRLFASPALITAGTCSCLVYSPRYSGHKPARKSVILRLALYSRSLRIDEGRPSTDHTSLSESHDDDTVWPILTPPTLYTAKLFHIELSAPKSDQEQESNPSPCPLLFSRDAQKQALAPHAPDAKSTALDAADQPVPRVSTWSWSNCLIAPAAQHVRHGSGT